MEEKEERVEEEEEELLSSIHFLSRLTSATEVSG